jgi:hypothetical protein
VHAFSVDAQVLPGLGKRGMGSDEHAQISDAPSQQLPGQRGRAGADVEDPVRNGKPCRLQQCDAAIRVGLVPAVLLILGV